MGGGGGGAVVFNWSSCRAFIPRDNELSNVEPDYDFVGHIFIFILHLLTQIFYGVWNCMANFDIHNTQGNCLVLMLGTLNTTVAVIMPLKL